VGIPNAECNYPPVEESFLIHQVVPPSPKALQLLFAIRQIASCVALIICLFARAGVAQSSEIGSEAYILDPGHSPASPGATSCSGISEYLYNENLAETVASLLRKRRLNVTTTRKNNENIPLLNRAAAAKEKRLFLSIHHDSVQPQFIVRDARKRPCSSKAHGYSIFISRKNKHYTQSLSYATSLGTALLTKGLTPTLHHAEKIPGENRELLDSRLGIYLFDDLVVLKNSDAPAVLFEAAVIVHPKDEVRASSKTYRMKIAEAILEMVESNRASPKCPGNVVPGCVR
jgi:N-acetylmuramoyl-L-alanine amidase